jgi:DNA primase
MAIDVLLSRLSKVKQTGQDKWLACCPSHGDKSPSLTIRLIDDGRILVHCFAGCGACDVVESVGLTMSELFPERLGEFKQVAQPFSAADALRAHSRICSNRDLSSGHDRG